MVPPILLGCGVSTWCSGLAMKIFKEWSEDGDCERRKILQLSRWRQQSSSTTDVYKLYQRPLIVLYYLRWSLPKDTRTLTLIIL